MIELPRVCLDRVLRRVDEVWHPEGAAHHILHGMTGSGKSTLIRALLGLCPDERVLVLDPKPHPDPIWDGPADDPWRWGKPVTQLLPVFGAVREGGGPAGLWFRLSGTPDRAGTARRFAEALAIIAAEGHCILVLDDVREICRQLRLAGHVDSVMNLGRSGNVLAILSATETAWVTGRSQGGMIWSGHVSGLQAAKDGAGLLGRTGRDWHETTGAVAPHDWIFSESQPGTAGPCLVTTSQPKAITEIESKPFPSADSIHLP